MDVVAGVDGLRPEHGPIFAVVGVFDGLHLGHQYLLEHLIREATARAARATVITFDHHPDEVLVGAAPPLLLHPDERLERLGASGVAVTVVQHFDEAVRHTTYDAFVHSIRATTVLAGLLMTPDAGFGFERRGTPETLATLGARDGFDVVVVPTFTLDGRSVRSSDVRVAISAGDLVTAAALLGRPVTIRGDLHSGVLTMPWPIAMPPDGEYSCTVDGAASVLTIRAGDATLTGMGGRVGHVSVTLTA